MNQKPKRQKANAHQDRSAKATPPRQTSETKPAGATDSALDRVMNQATHPGRLVTYAVVLVIIVVGWRWPQYVVDPTSVSGRARYAVAFVIASILFLLFSTLTLLAYSLAFGGNSEVNRKFVAAVLNRAGIGATLGGLLGVRLAPALLGDPASADRATFPEYLSDVGNVITTLTLVFVATVWPYSLGPLRQAVIDVFERLERFRMFERRHVRAPDSVRKWTARLIVFLVNANGVQLAMVVFFALIRR